MGKIPENTLNINEMTMYCSAQKQGKDVSLQDPQHTQTPTKMFAVHFPSVKAIQKCTEGNLHTSSYLRPARLCQLGKRGSSYARLREPRVIWPLPEDLLLLVQ